MKSHRTDGISLTFGVVFLLIVAWYVAARLVDLDLPLMGWSVAGGLIVLGLLGLVGALRSGRAGVDDRQAATLPPSGVHEREADTVAGFLSETGTARLAGQRVADADRAPVAERLRAALDDGRLTFPEYNDRLQLAYLAVTHEELDQALSGVDPRRPPQPPDGPEPRAAA